MFFFFFKLFIVSKFFLNCILFAYTMKHSISTAQGVSFLCMFFEAIIFINQNFFFGFLIHYLIKTFYFIWFSYTKMGLVILYASCFSSKSSQLHKKLFLITNIYKYYQWHARMGSFIQKIGTVTTGGTSRVYSSCSIHVIVAHMGLPFFKIFSNFVHFCPNF